MQISLNRQLYSRLCHQPNHLIYNSLPMTMISYHSTLFASNKDKERLCSIIHKFQLQPSNNHDSVKTSSEILLSGGVASSSAGTLRTTISTDPLRRVPTVSESGVADVMSSGHLSDSTPSAWSDNEAEGAGGEPQRGRARQRRFMSSVFRSDSRYDKNTTPTHPRLTRSKAHISSMNWSKMERVHPKILVSLVLRVKRLPYHMRTRHPCCL